MSESLRRGIELLEALRTADAGLGVRELAARVGLPKSTVARLLKTLDDTRLASQDPTTRRYQLGPRTLALGAAYQARLDLRLISVAPMRRLRNLTGESVGLSVALGAERMFIEEVQSVSELRTTSELGHPYPIWAGAPGRVLIAGMTAEQRAATLADADPDAWRMATPASRDGLLALLAEIAADGYATASNESVPGVSAVAAPIHDHAGAVVAALSISGPSGRFTDTARHAALTELFATARTITAALGGPHP